MQFRIRDAVGFEINDKVASELGLLEGFNSWKEDYNISTFNMEIDEKYKLPNFVEPMIYNFEYQRGGEIQSLEGFEWNKTYCWFFSENTKRKGWKPFINRLKKKGIALESARWSELG